MDDFDSVSSFLRWHDYGDWEDSDEFGVSVRQMERWADNERQLSMFADAKPENIEELEAWIKSTRVHDFRSKVADPDHTPKYNPNKVVSVKIDDLRELFECIRQYKQYAQISAIKLDGIALSVQNMANKMRSEWPKGGGNG